MTDTNTINPQDLVNQALGVEITDETPLAFAKAAQPVEPTPTVAPVTPTPVEPKSVKPKNKMVGIVAAIVLLVASVVGGVWAYSKMTKTAQIAELKTTGTCNYCSTNTCIKCAPSNTAGDVGECTSDNDCKPGSPNAPLTCKSGEIICGSSCVNAKQDKNNCGDCGVKCGSGESCIAGQCKNSGCGNGATDCGGLCVQLDSNKDNCGACGTKCSGDSICYGAKCIDTKTDVDNCGKIGFKCSSLNQNGAVFSVCENSVCKTVTDAQCRSAGQDPCDTKYAYYNIGHTCCAKGYKCDVGPGYDNGCVQDKKSPNPSPSGTPTPVMACTGLAQSPVTESPTINQTLTFTCTGTITPASAGTVSYKYRYSINGGAYTAMTGNTLTITSCGSYAVECQACATISGSLKCSPTWTGATP